METLSLLIMVYCVRVKDGVQFTVIAPGGFALLSAIDLTAKEIKHDLTITSACDGTHSGPTDPHHRGEAYDIRTKDLPSPQHALETLQVQLGPLFFAWIEDEGEDNEHIHCQVRRDTVYPPL